MFLLFTAIPATKADAAWLPGKPVQFYITPPSGTTVMKGETVVFQYKVRDEDIWYNDSVEAPNVWDDVTLTMDGLPRPLGGPDEDHFLGAMTAYNTGSLPLGVNIITFVADDVHDPFEPDRDDEPPLQCDYVLNIATWPPTSTPTETPTTTPTNTPTSTPSYTPTPSPTPTCVVHTATPRPTNTPRYPCTWCTLTPTPTPSNTPTGPAPTNTNIPYCVIVPTLTLTPTFTQGPTPECTFALTSCQNCSTAPPIQADIVCRTDDDLLSTNMPCSWVPTIGPNDPTWTPTPTPTAQPTFDPCYEQIYQGGVCADVTGHMPCVGFKSFRYISFLDGSNNPSGVDLTGGEILKQRYQYVFTPKTGPVFSDNAWCRDYEEAQILICDNVCGSCLVVLPDSFTTISHLDERYYEAFREGLDPLAFPITVDFTVIDEQKIWVEGKENVIETFYWIRKITYLLDRTVDPNNSQEFLFCAIPLSKSLVGSKEYIECACPTSTPTPTPN